MLALHRGQICDWKPKPVVAIAESEDYVAIAREDGAIEILETETWDRVLVSI